MVFVKKVTPGSGNKIGVIGEGRKGGEEKGRAGDKCASLKMRYFEN